MLYLLQRQVSALKEVIERINRHRKKSITLEEVRDLLNGSLEVSRTSCHITAALLRRWYDDDVVERGGVSTVPISWTWARYESWCRSHSLVPDLGHFHESFRGLQKSRKIELIPHSGTENLSERESEISLTNERGEVLYYWKWRS